MKVTGIVVEYNPLHQGHILHLNKAKEITQADIVIAVMSGNFTQRGIPAICDKWERTKAALQEGVDIVIELPYIYATQSANNFAQGAIDCLAHYNIDSLVFGSESNNLANLQEIADSCINVNNLKENLNQGHSFVKSYSLLSTQMEANDILGVAYLKALKKHPKIKPFTIQRTNSYHDTTISSSIASAKAIRQAFSKQEDIRLQTPMHQTLNNYPVVYIEQFFNYLKTYLLMTNNQKINQFFLVNEGIENHLINQIKKAKDYQEFIGNCVNRRYTKTRIQRTALQIMMQVSKEEVQNLPSLKAPRILGFNENGRKYLRQLKKADYQICTKFADLQIEYRELELRACYLYTSNMPYQKQQELIKKEIGGPIYLK